MCLDVEQSQKSGSNLENTSVYDANHQKSELKMEHAKAERNGLKTLCGGSLIDHKPIFDDKGEIVYIVRHEKQNDKICMFSIETGELIRELTDNKDGNFTGIFLDPIDKKTIITGTSNGKILFWKTDSCVIIKKLVLDIPNLSYVSRFLLTIIDDVLHGVIHYVDRKALSKVILVELSKGKIVQEYNLPSVTDKPYVKLLMADGNGYFVVLHRNSLYVIDKQSNEVTCHGTGFPAYVVTCHPHEQVIATGDQKGKIFLWHNIFSKKPSKTLLHWHHLIVLSLEFSQSGTMLYSGGAECVLVKWHIKETTLDKNFLPRVNGSIKQIAVDAKRDKITISLDDNSIRIINSNLDQLKTIQDFTLVSPFDLGLNQPYPVGIKVNPRNRHLVMNGKIGHLQFFSTKSMRLLFNVDITLRNAMPRNLKCNTFSTEVTHTAFSSCGTWMATVEDWNDKVHSNESRLKFWKFLEDKQTYVLHTQIEQAHEDYVTCLEFSGGELESPICATAGLDRIIRIWSLEASEEIKNPKKVWMHIEQLTYKNLPVRSLCFSGDSSLIAAGVGNTLCIWDTINFKLKCALSAPAYYEGSTNRVVISLPSSSKKKSNGRQDTVAKLIEKRQKLVKMMKSIIDEGNSSLINNITQEKTRYFKNKSENSIDHKSIQDGEKKLIFEHILANRDLNFNEKLQVFHKLNIYYKISNRVEEEVIDFISRQAIEETQLYKGLHKGLNEMKSDDKYKLLWRFKTWRNLDLKRNRKIVTVRKLLRQSSNQNARSNTEKEEPFIPIKNLTHITNTIFCSGDLSHLTVVTTPSRILIWNLLTLKLEGSYKMHTKFITIDPLTNLLAVFTKYNELYVIQPSPAMSVFHRKNLPDIHGAIWVPHDRPRLQTIAVNWQAVSRLLFLTEYQEICALSTNAYHDDDDDDVIEIPYMEEINQFTASTPFAAMISKKSKSESSRSGGIKSILANSTGHIKEVINLSNHAMPPARLLAKDFIASMISGQQKQELDINKNTISDKQLAVETMIVSDDEGEDISERDKAIMRRKAIQQEEESLQAENKKKKEAVLSMENKLKSLKLENSFDFEL